ncbi:MAG: twin-arginine translocation signal domain-containing protein, partial [Alphaproteobacteria bacterium]
MKEEKTNIARVPRRRVIPVSRRKVIKAAGVAGLAAGLGPFFHARRARAAGTLRVLVWSHFVPRFDNEWFDNFAQQWGTENDVDVTVDHISLAEIPARTAAEVSAGSGHDLIEWVFPPSQFE